MENKEIDRIEWTWVGAPGLSLGGKFFWGKLSAPVGSKELTCVFGHQEEYAKDLTPEEEKMFKAQIEAQAKEIFDSVNWETASVCPLVVDFISSSEVKVIPGLCINYGEEIESLYPSGRLVKGQ